MSTAGKGAYVEIDAGGTPTDISQYCTSAELSRARDTYDVTTFGDDDREFVAGLRGADVSIEGPYDATGADYLEDGFESDTAITIGFGPIGNTSGNPKYTAECLVESYTVTSPVDGKVMISASIKITGAVTRSTF